MSVRALKVPAEGRPEEVDLESFGDLYPIIGTDMIEVTDVGDGCLFSDQDGFPKKLPSNRRASAVCGTPIVGDVVFTSLRGPDGVVHDVPQSLIDQVNGADVLGI